MRSVVCFVALLSAIPSSLMAQSPIQLQRFEGNIHLASGGPVPFMMKGEAPVLGKFTSYGEITLAPGQQPGSLVGQGVVVVKDADGDTLVGETTWSFSPVAGGHRMASMQFKWRETIRTSQGDLVSSTGRYALTRPGDMTANGIIAILIGLLVPV